MHHRRRGDDALPRILRRFGALQPGRVVVEQLDQQVVLVADVVVEPGVPYVAGAVLLASLAVFAFTRLGTLTRQPAEAVATP